MIFESNDNASNIIPLILHLKSFVAEIYIRIFYIKTLTKKFIPKILYLKKISSLILHLKNIRNLHTKIFYSKLYAQKILYLKNTFSFCTLKCLYIKNTWKCLYLTFYISGFVYELWYQKLFVPWNLNVLSHQFKCLYITIWNERFKWNYLNLKNV